MNKSLTTLALMALMLTLLVSCTPETGNIPGVTPPGNTPASVSQVTLAGIADNPGIAGTPAPRAQRKPGHPLTNPADITTLELSHHQGVAPVTTHLNYENGEWQPTFLINTTGNSTITARHRPEPDVENAPPHISRYADLLQATADVGNGITILPTPPGGERTCQITFNMHHTRALLELGTVKNDLGHTLALATDPDIVYHITDADHQPRLLTTPIAPADAHLTGITLTLADGTRLTANGNIPLQGGKKYTPQLTLAQNTLTLHIPQGPSGIANWNEEFEVTQQQTHTVASEEDLIALRQAILADGNNYGKDFNVLQTANIELTGPWTSIYRFDGIYNGAGYTITGLRGTGGLFDYLYGQVANVHLREVNIGTTGNLEIYAGALANVACGANIACCSATGTVKGDNYAGGLVGFAQQNTTITRSRAACHATATTYGAGGLVAYMSKSTLIATGATGNATGITRAGGLTGTAENSQIFACYATGKASGTTNGGLVGHIFSGFLDFSYTTTSNLIGSQSNSPNFSHNWPDETGNKQGHESPWGAIFYGTAAIAGVPTWTGTGFEQRTFYLVDLWTSDPFPLINYNYAGN